VLENLEFLRIIKDINFIQITRAKNTFSKFQSKHINNFSRAEKLDEQVINDILNSYY